MSTEQKGRNIGVLLAALLATFIPLFLIEGNVLRQTGGVFMYPLDDTFIHMELAKNLAAEGTWGVNSGAFSSASSSVFYTLFLSFLFLLFGPNMVIPFIVNLIAGVLLLVVVQRWLQRQGLRPGAQLLTLLAIVFLVPLPIIIMSGMEHTLQCLFTFLFLTSFTDWVARMKTGEAKKPLLPVPVAVWGMLVTSIRYEGLFLLFLACLLLLYYRAWSRAFLLGAVALLPVLLFGMYSVLNGSYMLPNSVLVKSDPLQLSPGGIARYIGNILIEKWTLSKTGITAQATQRLLVILPFSYLLFRKEMKGASAYTNLFFLLTGGTLLHLALAATGWFYRYEAYLMLGAVVLLSLLFFRYGREKWSRLRKGEWLVLAVLLFFLFFPILLRTTAAFSKAGRACINIYEQQYQMGQFLKRYYDTGVIAANDIGAISFYTRGNIVDLWGLGSFEVAKSKKQQYWTPDFLEDYSQKQGARIAVVYDSWFPPDLLRRWQKVATWQVADNVILGGDTVSFYATDPAAAPELKQHLADYQRSLPPGVQVRYFY